MNDLIIRIVATDYVEKYLGKEYKTHLEPLRIVSIGLFITALILEYVFEISISLIYILPFVVSLLYDLDSILYRRIGNVTFNQEQLTISIIDKEDRHIPMNQLEVIYYTPIHGKIQEWHIQGETYLVSYSFFKKVRCEDLLDSLPIQWVKKKN